MGYDVAVWGTLTFPSEQAKARWQASPVDLRRYTDWPEPLAWEEEEFDDDFEPDDVAGVLADVRRLAAHVVEIVESPTRVDLRLHWSQSEHADWARELATAFRNASDVGGEGTLFVVASTGPDFGYRVDVGPAGSRVQSLDAAARAELAPAVLDLVNRAPRR